MADYKISLGIDVNTKDLQRQINESIRNSQFKKISLELNTKKINSQLNSVRKQIQNLSNIKVNLNMNGNFAGGSKHSIRNITNEMNREYTDLMNLAKRINSIRLQIGGLDASKNSKQIYELSGQLNRLMADYNNLYSAFNKKLSTDQIDNLNRAFESTSGKISALNAKMADNSVIQKQTQAYKELLSVSKEIGSLELNIAKLKGQGGNTNQIAELENQLKGLQSTYQHLVTTMDTPLTTEQWSSIYTQIAQTQDKLAQLSAKVADAKVKLAKKIELKLETGDFTNQVKKIDSDSKRLSGTYEKLEVGIKEVKQALNSMRTASNNGNIEGLISANERYERALKDVQNQLQINARVERDAASNMKLEDSRKAFQSNIDAWLTKNSAAAKKFGAQMLDLKAQAKSCDQVTLNHLRTEFKRLDKEAEAAGLKMQSFGDRLKTQLSKYSSYFSIASLFMWGGQGLRDMFEQVKLIDSAMTELKKVTDETDASYERFLTNAASKSKEIGTTLEGFVSSTADFARLGYGFEDAQGLAEVANIYAVVGDEIEGVEGATESLVSTLAAFKNEMNGLSDSDFALSIVDKMNEVSNNFSISSGGIGEALKRSASSMQAANNSLDETIALITAAM